ncbi:MAG: porin family protein [Bacteroidales bacterium]|nr:porin family protein [Bacteroidales bacterium]
MRSKFQVRYITVAFFALFPLFLSAQGVPKIPNLPKFDLEIKHFGFYLGYNQMSFIIRPIEGFQDRVWTKFEMPDLVADSARILGIESASVPGFTIGIVSNLRLSNYLDLRFLPGLQFGERQLLYHLEQYRHGDTLLTDVPKNIVSTYIDFPIYIKYKTQRVHNFRAFVTAGVSYKIDLSSSKKDKDNTSGEISVKLNKQDVDLDLGVGFDIYTVYFKFSTELKMSYGLLNLIRKEDNIYTNSIENLYGKIFQIAFTFE